MAQDDFESPLTHCCDRHFFGQSSPAAVAREVFKPSTDAASRLVSIKKYFFDLDLEFSWGDVTKWGCFFNYSPILTGPGRQSNEPFFGSRFFWKLGDHLRLQSP